MKGLDLTADEVAGLAQRHPALMNPPLRTRLAGPAVTAAIVGLFVFGLWSLDISPVRLAGGLVALARFTQLMVPPDPMGHALLFLDALAETLAISLLGTLIAAVLAFPVGLIAARNVVRNPVIHILTRRVLDIIRSVDVLVWALVWIGVVGLGPFAGVLAIACSDFGAFGKLFSETVETTGERARDGVRAAGGGRLHEVRFGLLPQVLPVIAGQVLYYFESNVRSATIIGIVGAGGIGLHLYEAIRTLEWREVSFLVLMILVAVAAMDWISSRLRAAMRA
ncbi:MAG: phosphonate ABC transporter, permease protein PhnE [Janthinobacterium lividum]